MAGPAYAGIPVTHRAFCSSVSFITGHEDPTKDESAHDWEGLAKGGGTLVFYMGVKNRFTPAGVETELLPHIPDPLFAHIRAAADHLKTIL